MRYALAYILVIYTPLWLRWHTISNQPYSVQERRFMRWAWRVVLKEQGGA